MKNLVIAIFAAAIFVAILMANRIYSRPSETPEETKTVTDYHGNIIVIPETEKSDEPWTPPVVNISADTNPASYTNPRAPIYAIPSSSDSARDFFSDAAFIGDSITVMLKAHNEVTNVLGDAKFIAKEGFGVGHAVNGTMLPEYEGNFASPEVALEMSGARKVFIMLGTNDVGVFGVDQTIEKWYTFIGRLREKCPDIQIYIQSCTPVWTGKEDEGITNAAIDKLNQGLAEFARENGCCFINTSPYMKDSTGGLPDMYTSDFYVHLNNTGADAWAKILLAYADAIMAKE